MEHNSIQSILVLTFLMSTRSYDHAQTIAFSFLPETATNRIPHSKKTLSPVKVYLPSGQLRISFGDSIRDLLIGRIFISVDTVVLLHTMIIRENVMECERVRHKLSDTYSWYGTLSHLSNTRSIFASHCIAPEHHNL